jgi:CBS domain containing-hemolysin-like protein
MREGKKIKDLMIPIEEYERIDAKAHLCDALAVLKRNYENAKVCEPGRFHKTLFVTDPSGKIIGKISMYDLIRGLVPESSKETDAPDRASSVRSSRLWEVEERAAELTERFGWLTRSFVDLVKEVAQKKVKDIMAPVHPILKEQDTVNQAIYLMFRENVRQPLVLRNGTVVGVIDLMRVFSELLEIAGPECDVYWEN